MPGVTDLLVPEVGVAGNDETEYADKLKGLASIWKNVCENLNSAYKRSKTYYDRKAASTAEE